MIECTLAPPIPNWLCTETVYYELDLFVKAISLPNLNIYFVQLFTSDGQEGREYAWVLRSDALEKVELTQEEEELKVTIAQKERMERDHDAIKAYYKVRILHFVNSRAYSRNGRMIWLPVL